MSCYLVTGAAGFIGSAVAQRLIDSNNEVWTIDNLTTGFRGNIPDGVKFIEGNCQDEESIQQLGRQKFDTIFHIAGQSSGEISFEDPIYDLQTNTQSTLQLLQYARQTDCSCFIYASTMSVYGDQPDRPVNEKAVLEPKSFYAVGKLASEKYLRIFSEFGMKNVALRIFNTYGPGQNMDNLKQGMVSIFMAQAFREQRVLVKGSRDRFRDFIYIDDVVKGFIMAANQSEPGFNCYNVGTGRKTTVLELLEMMKAMLPFDIEIEYSGSTPGDQFGIKADFDLIRKDLNWNPSTDLPTGLKHMIDWFGQSLGK